MTAVSEMYSPALLSQSLAPTIAVLVLLLILAAVIVLMITWLIARSWRHRGAQRKNQHPPQPLQDPWHTSGQRLIKKIDQAQPDPHPPHPTDDPPHPDEQ